MRTNVPGGIRVVALAASGERVASEPLHHGADPVHVLGLAGWAVDAPLASSIADDGALEIAYRTSPLVGDVPDPGIVYRDPDVRVGDPAVPHQRVAAYAVVTSARGVLLTEFTNLTNVEGEWGLPGGGLDEGEAPVDGLHREVWEETGQRVELGGLVAVQSSHWFGRAPSGVVEDFHAVRLVYAATCPSPGDPVVHDIGGTTADARWFAPHEIDGVPLTRSWRRLDALRALARRDYDAP